MQGMFCPKHELLGVPIDRRSLQDLFDAARSSIPLRCIPFTMVCANPHALLVARADGEFQAALRSASTVVADGVGCAVGAALAGVTIGRRIAGFTYFTSLMSALHSSGGARVFFFG